MIRMASQASSASVKVAVLYPTDPVGIRASGIDSVIQGMLKFAPPDIEYFLFGASTDPGARPPGRRIQVDMDGRLVEFLPLIDLQSGVRRRIPDVVRYIWALRGAKKANLLRGFEVLDFHRIEPAWLFRSDSRPQNLVLHQDMSVLRNADCDILWRHAPWIYEAFEQRVLKRMDRVYAVRQSAVERYKALYPSLGDRFRFMPTWVDTGIFQPARCEAERLQLAQALQASLDIAGPQRRFLAFVGRLDRQKDPLLLVKAFAAVSAGERQLHLLIIGDGDLRSEVERAVRSLGLTDRVTLLGVLAKTRIAQLLQACELFLLTSAYEGMPIAVLEALASGLPVVTTPVGEVALVVKNGKTGQICEQRSPEAFAQSIATALAGRSALSAGVCVQSIAAYRPEQILKDIFDNHRRQGSDRVASPVPVDAG